MANFCTNCGSELNPGAKFCVNCGQKVEQEQNPQAEAVATTVAGVVAGAASSADISYKKSIKTVPSKKVLLLPMLKKMYILTLMLILMVIAILRLILMNLSIPILPVKLTPMRIALRQHLKQARSF